MSGGLEGGVEGLILQIGDWPPALAYGLLAFSAFLENVLPPVPGDLVVVLSAYLAGRGVLDWLPVYAATCLGGTAGFMVMFTLGRRQGRAFLHRRRGRAVVFSSARLEQAEAWLRRYGGWLVLANRFLSGIRSVIALAAGTGGMPWRKVAVLGLASMALWNGLLLYAGMQVGQNWQAVTDLLARYQRGVFLVFFLVAAALVARWWRRRDRAVDRGPDRP